MEEKDKNQEMTKKLNRYLWSYSNYLHFYFFTKHK